jgi:aspartyl protease family protein
MKAGGWFLLAIGAGAVAGLVMWLAGERPGALDEQDNQIRLVHLLLILTVVGAGFIAHWRARPTLAWLRDGTIWLGIGLSLLALYSFRFELGALGSRILAELIPGRAIERAPGEMIFRASQDGHFRIDAVVDGTPIRFLVDTGASSVVLSLADAARIGINVAGLHFGQQVRTANGIGLAAPIRLREIRIGGIVIRDLAAMVNQTPMDQSLLGISYLERLSGYSVRNGILTFVK